MMLDTDKEFVLLIGTNRTNRGGISSVIDCYFLHSAGMQFRQLITHEQRGRIFGIYLLTKAIFLSIVYANKKNCKIFHIHTASHRSFFRKSLFWIIGKLWRKPIIFHIHGGEFINFYNRSNVLCRKSIRFILQHSDLIIVLTEHWKILFLEVFPDINITVIPNPVEQASSRSHILRKSGQILFLGKANQQKGLWDLYTAFRNIRTTHDDVKLVCCGDGDLEYADKLAKKLGIHEAVEHLGWISGSRKTQLLLESTVLVLPSYVEGLPMVILEALAHGLPIITTPVGGIPDVISHLKTGYLVQPGDVNELTKAIKYCLDNPKDMQFCSENGISTIKNNMLPSIVMAKLKAAYLRILQAPTRNAGKKVSLL
jgi:glycosyltransferase involved in cell wall biosynthesis